MNEILLGIGFATSAAGAFILLYVRRIKKKLRRKVLRG